MQPKSAESPGIARSGVRKVTVPEDSAGQRIDNFLRRELPGVPRGRLYRMLRRGEVRVPPARLRAEGGAPPPERVRDLAGQILFEDRRLLVVNKPSGLAAHGGSGVSHGVIELLRAARPELRDLALVHRLDRDTSGCLVLAKRRSTLRELHALFREGRVEKNYLALVIGDWQHGELVVEAPLLVRHRRGGERHVIVSPDGKPAATRFRLARGYRDYSLLQCQPLTGRTHQIRVHAAHAGHPIAGDERYGEADANRRVARLGLKRLFLHAQSIAFPDADGNERHFTAPLCPELDRFLIELLSA